MASRKSKVWDYFEKQSNNKQAKCKLCKETVASSGGTTNLNVHLVRHHKINLQIKNQYDGNNNDVKPSKLVGGGDRPTGKIYF
jgi:hypothetical protein